MTDQQIAIRLNISSSTVNTYWGRVRGKLGFSSRTEFVARALRSEAADEMSQLLKANMDYEAQARERKQLEGDLQSADLYRCALDAMPDAVLIRDRGGKILYTNSLLDKMFGYDRGALISRSLDALVPANEWNPTRPNIDTCIVAGEKMQLGVCDVLYGRNRAGFYFRVVLLLSSVAGRSGPISSCIFRRFGEVVEEGRDHVLTLRAIHERRVGLAASGMGALP